MSSRSSRRLAPASLYARERESLLVPLPFLELPPELELEGRRWSRKNEFHVTAANTGSIVARLADAAGLEEEDAEDRAWEALSEASREASVGAVILRDELRRVRREEEETLIVLCEVDGLGQLFERLAERLGAELEPPPAHVTLYVEEPGAGGIGLHTGAELERSSSPVAEDEAEELLRALAATLG